MPPNPQGTPGPHPAGSTVLVPVGPSAHVSHRGSAPPSRGGLDRQGLLRAFRRRWVLAVLLGLLFGGAGTAAVWFFLPAPSGTAAAQLHIDAVPKALAFRTEERPGEYVVFQNTQTALARSRLVLTAALRNPKVPPTRWFEEVGAQGDPLDWLEQNLKVAFSGTEIMQISI